MNAVDRLDKMKLPPQDRRIIGTPVHAPGGRLGQRQCALEGTRWTGSQREREELRNDFERAAAWSQQNKRPLYLGEFGAYREADMEDRALWTRAVAREFQLGSYWEFCSEFGAYDPAAERWRRPLLNALWTGTDTPGSSGCN
jgi:endoglucanase